jgi:HAD superfamily hydrolase (TIGR01549 family)
MATSRGIAAISFDFFNTLVTHRDRRGRGARVMEYFRAQGWESSPWEHAALYDVFAECGSDFAVTMNAADMKAFCGRVARALFRRLNVSVDDATADTHGVELWRILGPDHLEPFPETTTVLAALHAAGYRIAITSNWQHGLRAFCEALGFGAYVDVVLSSAEVGVEKPDGRIFAETCRRLALPADRILHVGDTEADDVVGARGAGLRALWLRRDLEASPSAGEIRNLNEVETHLASGGN